MLERPNVGNGIGDRFQSMPLRLADLDRPAAISAITLHFPPRAGGEAAANEFRHEAVGTLTTASENRNGKPGAVVRFKPRGDLPAAAPVEVVFIGFDRTRPGLEFQWRSAPLLRNPDLFPLAFWVLQKSTLELGGGGARPRAQRLAFKPVTMPAVPLAEPNAVLPWPAALPPETTVLPPRVTDLPAGWEANWYTDWDEKDASRRTAANAHQVLRFKKPTSSSQADAWFLLTFQAGGMAAVESTFARRVAQDTVDRDRNAADLRSLQAQIAEATARAGGTLPAHMDSVRDLLTRRDHAQKLVAAISEALDAYRELKAFDVQFRLTDGLPLASVRFEPPALPAGTDETGK
jgi:hypothetical protein